MTAYVGGVKQAWGRDLNAKRPPRKPLRTLVEMAEEFGVGARGLASMMNNDQDGPRPEVQHKGTSRPASWYDPEKVRAWWRKRQDQVAVAASAASAAQAERA